MSSKATQLKQRIDGLDATMRERYAERFLEVIDRDADLEERLRKGLAQLERGEGTDWEGSRAFLDELHVRHGLV